MGLREAPLRALLLQMRDATRRLRRNRRDDKSDWTDAGASFTSAWAEKLDLALLDAERPLVEDYEAPEMRGALDASTE